jgi:hypothetical protein
VGVGVVIRGKNKKRGWTFNGGYEGGVKETKETRTKDAGSKDRKADGVKERCEDRSEWDGLHLVATATMPTASMPFSLPQPLLPKSWFSLVPARALIPPSQLQPPCCPIAALCANGCNSIQSTASDFER